MTATSSQLLYPGTTPIPHTRHPRLQRFYLFLGISVFASVVYFSSVKPQSSATVNALSNHYGEEKNKEEITVSNSKTQTRPNILFIVTDDQDIVLSGAEHMPNTRQLLAEQGTTLQNAFVASPLCCPSRSSILTGRYVHNHEAINNSLSGHCGDEYWQQGPEKQTLAVHLQSAGYRTFFAGKYLNQYGRQESGGVAHVPPGWHWWVGLKGNSRYYNYTLSINGSREQHGDDTNTDYLTDVIWQRARQFLESDDPIGRSVSGANDERKNLNSYDTGTSGSASDDIEDSEVGEKPFFMMLSTPASHAPFTPKPEYSTKFANLSAPRTENFNLKNKPTKHWLLRLGEQPLSDSVISKVDEIFRNRLQTLLTVDDMIGDLISLLEKKSLLDNTYIVFTSDNGYHLGQFSLPLDKRQPYEFDIRVPLIVRGPGVKAGMALPHPTINVDLAPTLLDLAGVAPPDYMDGVSLKDLLLGESEDHSQHPSSSGLDIDESKYTVHSSPSELSTANSMDVVAVKTLEFNADNNVSINEHLEVALPVRQPPVLQARSMLIEHSGEGYAEQSGPCSFVGAGLYGCNPDLDCKCSDSSNNTYSCVRHIQVSGNTLQVSPHENRQLSLGSSSNIKLANESLTKSPASLVKNTVFCVWEDTEQFVEYYDLNTDQAQLHNIAGQLSAAEMSQHMELLERLRRCSGRSCYTQG